MRASEERRELTVAQLRERALDGCVSLDTFASRVDAALRAKTIEELEALEADLPPRREGTLRRLLSRLRRRPSRSPAVEIEVRLPSRAGPLIVGRSRECDVVVGEETVSRVHAELRHGDDDAWIVRDLDSTNGTWLNGSRVREARVCGGDVLSLGGLRMELRL
jgi:hypothetical protein